MDREQIDNAVTACLAHARGSERPFQQLADFLLVLRGSEWPQEAIREVQNRVIEGLSVRPGDPPGDA